MVAAWLCAIALPAFAATPPAASSLTALPRTTGDVTRPECVDALRLAGAMFRSGAPFLYAPLTFPPDLQSRMVFGATAEDITADDALQVDPGFEKLSVQEGRVVYWARVAEGGHRVVISSASLGWRGDLFSLYLLEASLPQAAFLASLTATPARSLPGEIGQESWRPPLVFQAGSSGAQWVVQVGQSYEILADWRVHSVREAREVCRIAFQPPGGAPARLLPPEVRTLARLLDATLGPGREEGTLQPTARMRLHAQQVLGNAALRPWAVADAT